MERVKPRLADRDRARPPARGRDAATRAAHRRGERRPARRRGSSTPAGPTTKGVVLEATVEGRMFTVLAAGFALAALLVGENLVFLLGCLLLGSALAGRLPARLNLRGVEARREAPRRARVGAPFRVTYHVLGRARGRAVGVVLHDEAAAGVRPASVRIEIPVLEPGATLREDVSVHFTRRGWRTLGRLALESRWPFALVQARRELPSNGERVLVRPAVGRPTGALLSRLAGSSTARARPSLRHRGPEALHGIREFRAGDDPRRIHWKTSARRGVLTLTQWRREVGRRIVIVLGRSGGAGGGASRAFERAVSVAATLWVAAHRLGLPVVLHLGDEPTPGTAHGGHRGREAGLDALAVVPAQGGRRPRAVLRRLAAQTTPAVVVYVAAREEPGLGARLAAAAGARGDGLALRADTKDADRWVKGLPWDATR